MWRHHLIVLAVLVALALPVYILDYFLLKPSGDIFLLNLRSMLISAYVAWLAIHIALSSLAVWVLKSDRLYTLHGVSAAASVGLLFVGLHLVQRWDAAQGRAKHEARMAMRQTLFDTITLEKWWYEPGSGKPHSIGAVLLVKHSGRLAARVSGHDRSGSQVYAGEMRPQKRVTAGERIDYVFSLKYYSDEQFPDVRFTFYLFRDKEGSAPENITKEYAAIPERTDDGQYFRDVLPPPVQSPPSRTER
jgi:hypothetical protein